ncbi:nicotinamide riboside transporter PnuC [Streptococcaceae bacterium ESL0729]|nr:nicotinamide riboside transporter PnuC [Streptococcaceae bacterium ESL0729]
MNSLQEKFKNLGVQARILPKNLKMIFDKARKLGFVGIIKLVFADIFLGRSLLGWLYLLGLCSVQIIAYILRPDSLMGMIAGLTGIICVIFVNEKRASNYLFGFINALIYFYMSLQSNFYGEVLTTSFFTIMQPIGLYMWLVADLKPQSDFEEAPLANKLSLAGWLKSLVLIFFVWLGMGYANKSIGASRPFRDSVAVGSNVTGQVLMSGGYAEQWIFWGLTNIFSIYLWWGQSFEIVIMFWVYLLNSVVGWVNWTMDVKHLKGRPVNEIVKGLFS